MLDTLEIRAPVKTSDPSVLENLTQVGNAKRLIKRHRDKIRYVHGMGKWLVWDGTRWAIDDTGAVMRLAKETVVSIYADAPSVMYDGDRAELVKWGLKSESKHHLESMISLARTEPEISLRPDELDANQWLLNCRNVTIDLKTWQIGDHQREDLITRRLSVDFDAKAKCPNWFKFLRRVLSDDEETCRFVQRAIGYSLTGSVSEQVFFFMFGSGRNGKSTFIEVIQALLGEYVTKTPTETLMAKDRASIPNDVARLAGKRMVVARETDEGQRLAEAVVKDLTGGDRIVARYLHQEFFEFDATFKIWMYGNHKPIVRNTDEGIWRRMRLIPFTVTIPLNEVDPDLELKLLEELPGILNWALVGCQEWMKQGLGESPAVHQATAEYRSEMDVLGTFISEICTLGSDKSAKARDLYEQYSAWCTDYGERAMSQRQLGVRLKERGFHMRRSTGGARLWDGLSVPLSWLNDS